MTSKIDEMRTRQVVCVDTGTVLGYVSDIVFDTVSGKLTSLIILGRPKLLGLLGSEDDIIIPWSDIQVIGEETILVRGSYYNKKT